MLKRFMSMMIFALAILSLTSLAHAGLKKGPYVQKVTKTAATIAWETNGSAGGTVYWGTDEDLGETLDALPGVMHEVDLEGLKANTRYCYQVESEGETSSLYCFKTAPEWHTNFRFVAYGDSRSGYAEHRQITERIMQEEPDIYLNSGDLVCDGPDEICWQWHFDIERELMATKMLIPAIGNHDVDGTNTSQYRKYFALPEHVAGPEYQEHFFYTDWGNTRFIALDSEVAGFSVGGYQYNWLIAVLQDAKEDPDILHIFLSVHEGPYTAKPGRSGNQGLRRIAEELADYNVTAIFSGHDHHYYRATDPNGLEIIVTGGGGAGLYDCEPRPDYGLRNHMCVKKNHYIVFEVEGKYATATVKTIDGDILETFQFVSPKEPREYDPNEDNGDDGEDNGGDGGDNGDDIPDDGADTGDDPTDTPNVPTGPSMTGPQYDPNDGFSGCNNMNAAANVFGFILLGLVFASLFVRRRIK